MAAPGSFDPIRRHMLIAAGLSAGCLLNPGRSANAEQKPDQEETKVSPPEDLMREHDVLHRIMLVYQKIVATQAPPAEWPAKSLTESARLTQRFIEEYHQKLEEDYVFPAFEKAGKMTDLTAVLRKQHDAATRLTQAILKEAEGLKEPADAKRLTQHVNAYIAMYEPHSAREGSVLFPALHTVVKPKDYEDMGERFEEIEHKKFGESGFEGIVTQVAAIEKALGIYDLSQFTPKEI